MLMTGSRCHLIIPALTAVLVISFSSVHSAELKKIIATEQTRTAESAKSQRSINNTHDKSKNLLADYKQVLKTVEGLEVYNGLLQKQLDDQNNELLQLDKSVKEVSLIERQIIPLMVKMIDSLDQFVNLDMPFLAQERTLRVAGLKKMMQQFDVTAAEKFRRVIEAYQIENEYGRTIEAYRGMANIAGKQREVDFLRIGRIALIYQTDNKMQSGTWDLAAGKWSPLPAETYRNQVSKGLKIARKQIAPDLLMMPVNAAEMLK